ncbi:MAG: hypothetical protein CVT89_01255 [Candidatus Altiarchaeales archaeon HGW-Altiarchaeales-2]|nr:MAG: hypothetical protein CVT89_01255 [Candidatus Altiarchaeales archaeon HGW-Altiarchaeales-2]
MKSLIKIFEIFGISVNLHISFLMFILLLFALLVFSYGFIAGIVSIFLFFILFSIVVLHELSHSLVAIEFGFKVRSITLLPLGGAADVEMDENPKAELLMAFAGPLFNILFAWICLVLLMFLTPNWSHYLSIFGANFSLDLFGFLGWLIWINFILAAFNLLPAFPMDGGRVLRAFLALFMDYLKATKISLFIAKILFVLMMLVGLFLTFKGYTLNGMMLVFIAMFLFFAGNREVKWTEAREKFKGMKNRDIAVRLQETDGNLTVGDVLNLSSFTYPHSPFFVVTMNGKVVGVIKTGDIMNKRANNKINDNMPVYEVMNKDVAFIGADGLVTKSFGKILSADLCVVEENGIVIGYITRDMIIRQIK